MIVSLAVIFACLRLNFFKLIFLATCIFFYYEPELGVGINPGMALTPFPSSNGRGSNPQPSDCEPSALPLDHSFHLPSKLLGQVKQLLVCNLIQYE